MFSLNFLSSVKKGMFSFITVIFLAGCSQASDSTESVSQNAANTSKVATSIPLDVFKNPSCGCCKKWIDHVNQNGFQSTTHNSANLSTFKQERGIAPRYRSCHTAVSQDGYIFEGHVPAKFIQQFLIEKPEDALGLSVPAMPVGTPGMEMGDRFMPYQVLLLKVDGSSEIYSTINTYEEQF